MIRPRPLLRVQVGLRRSRHHHPIKAKRSTTGATVLQAGAVEVTAPSDLAAMVGIVKTQLPQLGQELRATSRFILGRAS
jgi:hypothetical protein